MIHAATFTAGLLCGAFGAAYALAMFLSSSREKPSDSIEDLYRTHTDGPIQWTYTVQ